MKSKILSWQTSNPDVAALLLRLIYGGLFVQYGLRKILAFEQMLSMSQPIIGLDGKTALILVTMVEFGCGLLVTIGFLTRLAVIPLFFTMTVAFFVAHANDPFDVKALAFIFWVLSFGVIVLGSGRYSVDRLLFK